MNLSKYLDVAFFCTSQVVYGPYMTFIMTGNHSMQVVQCEQVDQMYPSIAMLIP